MRSSILIAVIAAIFMATTAFGQSVPLELWYSYLAGNTAGALAYSDSKNQTAAWTLSGGFTQHRSWQVRSLQGLSFRPGAESDNVDWPSELSGALQISSRSRYTVRSLAYDRDERREPRRVHFLPGEFYDASDLIRESNWVIDHNAFWWSTDSVEVAPERSMVVLLGGPRLGVGDHVIRVFHRAEGRKSEINSDLSLPDTTQGPGLTQTNDWRSHAGALEWLAGLSSRVEGQVTIEYVRSRTDAVGRYQIADFDPLSPTKLHSIQTNTAKQSQPMFAVRPGLTYIAGSRAWIYVEPGYSYTKSTLLSSSSEIDATSRELIYDDRSEYRNSANSYALRLHADWLTRVTEYSPRFLLDNFSGYYSQPLRAGTMHWRFDFAVVADRANTRVTYTSSRPYPPPNRSYARERNESQFSLMTTYYFRPRVRLSARIGSSRFMIYDERMLPTNWEQQRHELELRFEVSNVYYDPLQRKEISWAEVQPVDYILGPLLRPNDYRVQLRFIPPAFAYEERSMDGGLFAFNLGNLDDNWLAEISAARGVTAGFEAAFSAIYREYEDATSGAIYRREALTSIGVLTAWQPIDWLRLQSRLQSEYWDFGSGLDSGVDTDDWRLDISLTAVIP